MQLGHTNWHIICQEENPNQLWNLVASELLKIADQI